MKEKLLQNLKQKCINCASCDLHKTRNNIVFADGNPQTASIVLIGEAPGEKEDLQGIPFVGSAGKILNECLKEAGLLREKDLYIINTVKCRPPQNRKPKKSEKEACRGFLFNQIDIIKPKIIFLCGSTAMDDFLKGEKITQCHGKVFDIDILNVSYKAVPILHPSPLCRFPDKKNVMIKDFKKVREFIDYSQ